MSNTYLDLPRPTGNGHGASVDTSTMTSVKTIVVGTSGGVYEPLTAIEVSNDGGANWQPIKTFTGPGLANVTVAALLMRMTTSNFVDGVVPTVGVGSLVDTVNRGTLTATASNGHGAAADVSALGRTLSVMVLGVYQGTVSVEVSQDQTAWASVFTFQPGTPIQSQQLAVKYMRVSRAGVPLIDPGTPTVIVTGTTGGTGVTTDGTTVSGNGVTSTLAVIPAGLTNKVKVLADGVTVTGDGSTGNPLVSPASAGTTIYFNVKNYGATGGGVTDDTSAIRAAVAAAAAVGGGIVYFPDGTYLISEFGASLQCISVTSNNIGFLGQSRAAIIKLAATQRAQVRMIYCGPNVTDISFEGLKLDGNRPNQTDQTGLQHNDAVFLDHCTRVTMSNVEIAQPAASCVVLFTNTTDVVINSNCYFHDGGWIGVAMGDPGGQQNVTVRDSRLQGNLGGGFHIEVSQANNAIRLCNCYTDAPVGVSALEVAGNNVGGPTTWSDNVVLDSCQVVGSVLIGEVHGLRMDKCNITCADTTGIPALKITGQGSDIIVSKSRIVLTAAATSPRAVWVAGDANNLMSDVFFVDTDIYVQGTAADGIMIQQTQSCAIIGGSINGNSTMTAGHYGVNINSSALPNQGVIRVLDTFFTDFQYGVVAQSLGTVTCADVQVCRCTFDAVTNGVMAAGMSLDLDARHSVQSAVSIGNELVGNVTVMLATYPNVPMLVGGSRGDVGIYNLTGSPQNVLAAHIGSMAIQRDTGTTWINTTGANNGWHSINVT